MVEMIKEDQYRIFSFLLGIALIVVFIYAFVLANQSSNIKSIIKNPLNWVILVAIYLLYKSTDNLNKQMWKRAGIRDKIEEQTARKLKLENKLLQIRIQKGSN